MNQENHLYILWTNADPITTEKMVFMYGYNAMVQGWWENVTIIIWGATAKYVGESIEIQNQIRKLMDGGVNFTACKACSDQLGVTDSLLKLGIEVKYWGEPLTELLRSNAKLITI